MKTRTVVAVLVVISSLIINSFVWMALRSRDQQDRLKNFKSLSSYEEDLDELRTNLVLDESDLWIANTDVSEVQHPVPRPPDQQPCVSLYMQGGSNEHSPIIFERENLIVCRTAKVGSEELRRIQRTYTTNSTYSMEPWNGMSPGLTLAQVNNMSLFHNYLYGDDTTRIVFVRHPVLRILSGFKMPFAHGPHFWSEHGFKPLGDGPEAFRTWVLNTTFLQQYDPNCSEESTRLSRSFKAQHWLPPQHCRCGLWDCNVDWRVFQIEQHSIASVMNQYIPGPWITPESLLGRVHGRAYNVSAYLTPDVLEILNNLTRIEQKMFGYEPYVV